MLVKSARLVRSESSDGLSMGSRRSRAEISVNWARRHWEQSERRKIEKWGRKLGNEKREEETVRGHDFGLKSGRGGLLVFRWGVEFLEGLLVN